MRKLSSKIWRDSYKWQFEAYPFFTSVYQKSAAPAKNKYFTRFHELLNNFNNGQAYLLEPRKEIFKKGMMIIDELLSGNDNFYKEFKKVLKEVNEAIDICKKVRAEGKFAEIEKWWPKIQKTESHVTNILFNFDYPLDDFFKNLSVKSPKEFDILSGSIYSDIPSFINEANSILIKLNKKYPKNFNKVRKIFVAEFGWFQNSYIGKFSLTEKWLKKHLDEIKNFHPQKIKPAGALPEKFKLLAKTAILSIKFRDNKKKLLLIAVELMENWLRRVCRENGWKYDAMRWLSVDEVLEVLRKKKVSHIKNAKKYHKFKKRIGIMKPLGYEEVSEKFWNEIIRIQTPDNKVQEIRGVIANKGKYRGEARIIIDAKKEAKRFKNGDILITSMTRPEFLPLMAKAGAFVTDEGGISCHAAIIAREMGKPCIIGTKISTKILKDGDLVEVDANKGIVKILK